MHQGRHGGVLPGPGRPFRTKHSILPTVERGCCCSLETCCRVQGFLCALGTCCYVVGRLMELAFQQDTLFEHDFVRCSNLPEYGQRNRMARPTLSGDDDGDANGGIRVPHAVPCRTRLSWGDSQLGDAFIAVTMLLDTITFAVALLFLRGINMRSSRLMCHYVRLLKVHVAFNIFLAAMVSFLMGSILPFFMLVIFSAGIPFYCAVCANSLYIKIAAEEASRGVEMPPAYLPPGSGWAPPPGGPGLAAAGPSIPMTMVGPPGPPPSGPPLAPGSVIYMSSSAEGPPPYSPPAPGFVLPQPGGGYPSYPPYPTKDGPPPSMEVAASAP